MVLRIDSHQHFWTLARGDYDWITPDLIMLYRDFEPADLLPKLEAANMDGTILVQSTDTTKETEFLLAVAAEHDWIMGVVGWVDMEAGDAADQITRLAEHEKMVGIRPMIQGIEDDEWMLKPALAPAIRRIQELGLAFDALVLPRHLSALISFLEQYPDLRTVIDHGAKPVIKEGKINAWADHMSQIAQNSNAYCKLSGLVTEAAANWSADDILPYARHILDCFGTDRVMFGSDWPVLRMASDYKCWHAMVEYYVMGLTKAEKSAIFGGNAERFYLQRQKSSPA